MNGDISRENGPNAFSFVETMVALAITVALTASIGVPAMRYVERAKRVAARGEIETLRLCLQSYYLDCGQYPSTEQGLNSLSEKPELYPVPAGWQGPYADRRVPADPWGNAYAYKRDEESESPFVIVSYGADGREGGERDDADIRSDE